VTVSAADARTVDQLLGFLPDGGRPDLLMFWGHRPPSAGGVGKALLFDDAETAERIRQAPH
jgi:hypothetical protein